MVRFQRRKLLASCLCVTATVFLMVTLQVVVELGKFERKKLKDSNVQDGHRDVEGEPKHLEPFPEKEALALAGRTKVDAGSYPIVLWWSPLTGETGRLGQCGADACFFTINRTFQHHPMTRAFLFYVNTFYCWITFSLEFSLLVFADCLCLLGRVHILLGAYHPNNGRQMLATCIARSLPCSPSHLQLLRPYVGDRCESCGYLASNSLKKKPRH